MSDILELPQVAIQNFNRARRKAALRGAVTRLTGNSKELLSYDEVRKKLKGVESNTQTREVIPLEAIIGSLGRYNDFNRLFQPLKDSDQERWTGVKRAISSLQGVPPIDVYRIGDAYFVKDGNHRVSVARELGFESIEAYVTDVYTSVPVTADLDLDDLIIKSEQADFLEKTQLHDLRPESDLSVTVTAKYKILLEHIDVHKYYLGLETKTDIDYEAAVISWYDNVYLPVVSMIRKRGLFEDFPDRTETDLYLWLADERAQLNDVLGWDLEADTLTQAASEKTRVPSRLKFARNESPSRFLLNDVLVALSGTEQGWAALEQALVIASKENARIYAVHAVPDEASLNLESISELRERFEWRVKELGFKPQLAIQVGKPVDVVSERARYVDMVVANLAHPPVSGLGVKKGFEPFIRQTPRPVIAVPSVMSPITKAVIAYDGSSKSELALFAGAYAAMRWKIPIVVATVKDSSRTVEVLLDRAKTYMRRHGVVASFVAEEGSVANTLLDIVEAEQADLLMVGGYEYRSFLEPFFGGVLDDILRQSKTPMMICQ